MTTSTLTVKKMGGRRVTIEVDIDQFERLAANLGFFNPEFLKSLNRAEKDIKDGRVQQIHSLSHLE